MVDWQEKKYNLVEYSDQFILVWNDNSNKAFDTKLDVYKYLDSIDDNPTEYYTADILNFPANERKWYFKSNGNAVIIFAWKDCTQLTEIDNDWNIVDQDPSFPWTQNLILTEDWQVVLNSHTDIRVLSINTKVAWEQMIKGKKDSDIGDW